MPKYVAFDKDLGVFLGGMAGKVYWSKLDGQGVEFAMTFSSPDEVEETLKDILKASEIQVVEVKADRVTHGLVFASRAACIAAGLPGWNV